MFLYKERMDIGRQLAASAQTDMPLEWQQKLLRSDSDARK